jgi:selenide,water dikinase
MTTDFFAPLVDDPYNYGAIAAANAMSDVYAMGGEVVLALNIAAFPDDLPAETIAAILRGGADKVAEAGGIVAGGHTIIDAEPKFGLSVMGLVHPKAVLTKAGARVGNALFLTKPLGTGIVTTAAKQDAAAPEHLDAAIQSMTRLNRHASHLAREAGARALTDITGYSLLGHGYEMAAASGVALRFEASRVPLLPGALDYAARGIVTGGAGRNRAYLAGKVRLADNISEPMEHVLFDPQTSGGLLFPVAPDRAGEVEPSFATAGEKVWRVGEAVEGQGIEVAVNS